MNKMSSKLLSLLLICCLILGQTAPLLAGPQDGKVVAGSATIRQESATKTGITQTTDRVAIDWRSFSIAANEQVQFYQPSASSVALNRVVGPDASSIMGRLTANGQVFLVNPNGIIFGKGSQVDASGLMASTHNIRNEDFMAGRYLFNIPGKPGASVINEGIIRIADTGVAAFVAPAVANRGIIAAKLGKVALASANGFTLDFFGDQLLTFLVNDEVAKMAYDIQGNQLTSFVENSGRIEAQGGYVLLSAKAAEGVVHNVINQSGVIEATSVGQHNGEIVLSGGPRGVVSNTGTLDASGKNEGETGGKVLVTGEKLGLFAGTAIDVSGYAGGGKALIGGDYLGGRANDATMRRLGISRELGNISTASTLFMDKDAFINANALRYGNGGKIVLWSEELSRISGLLAADGGSMFGDGGFVETSSHGSLTFPGIRVKAGALNGKAGTWLLDPQDFTIDASNVADIENNLNGVGDSLGRSLNWQLEADRNVEIAATIVKSAGGDALFKITADFIYHRELVDIISGSGKLEVNYQARDRVWIGRGYIGGESNFATNGGSITFNGPNFVGVNGDIDAGAGVISIMAQNKEPSGVDKGIWIFGNTLLTASSIKLLTKTELLRFDDTAARRKIEEPLSIAAALDKLAGTNGITGELLEGGGEASDALEHIAKLPAVDMRKLKGEDNQKALVEAMRTLTGGSKAGAEKLTKVLGNAGDVLNIMEKVLAAQVILTANNTGALAEAINNTARDLVKELASMAAGKITATLLVWAGPIAMIAGDYIGGKAGEYGGEKLYNAFMARSVVLWSAQMYRNQVRQMNDAGSLLGV